MSRIYITGTGKFEGAELEIGRHYEVTPYDAGTDAQNRAYWALLTEYFKSGLFSYQAKNVDQLHKYIKRFHGAGFESFFAAVQRYNREKQMDVNELLEFKTEAEARKSGTWYGKSQIIRGRLKSFAKYTKEERKRTIDGLIAEAELAGINSAKWHEMRKSMEEYKN